VNLEGRPWVADPQTVPPWGFVPSELEGNPMISRTKGVAHPFDHGHFEHFGPGHRYEIARIDRDARRFWLPGEFYFQVADWDWPIAADWCWDCADDFVLY
jgi:hypothetical protein